MGKVLGIGGVFLRAKDPKALQKWYSEHLGIPLTYGISVFEGQESFGQTVFSFFLEEKQPAIVNFRVDALDEVMDQLATAGVRIDPKRDDSEYGKFGWFWDPEGNRVELWEPPKE